MKTFQRKHVFSMFIGIGLVVALMIASPTSPAHAYSQTCILAPGGSVCTSVYGSGTWVGDMAVSRINVNPFTGALAGICDYSAWYFAALPGGGIESLGTEMARGCVPGRVWLTHSVQRHFPVGTQLCAKFYENFWSNLISEKCVGIS